MATTQCTCVVMLRALKPKPYSNVHYAESLNPRGGRGCSPDAVSIEFCLQQQRWWVECAANYRGVCRRIFSVNLSNQGYINLHFLCSFARSCVVCNGNKYVMLFHGNCCIEQMLVLLYRKECILFSCTDCEQFLL